MSQDVKLRWVDRGIIALLAALLAASGVYLIGPWYLEVLPNGHLGPVYSLFKSTTGVRVLGGIEILTAIALFCCLKANVVTKFFAHTMMITFMVRLFITLGNISVAQSWRPPDYLSNVFMVGVPAIYWLWVRLNEGRN